MSSVFSWGIVQREHAVGPYTIIEYDEYKPNSRKPSGQILFHGEIDGKDAHESWLTLDEALSGLIVRRNLGPNHRQISQHFIAGILAVKENNK